MYKICHLTSVHSIDDTRIFAKECTSLADYGFDVTLIACGKNNFEDIKNDVKRISLCVSTNNRLLRIIKCANTLYKQALKINADIYHLHDPELIPIGLRLKKLDKKVIFDSHEFYGEQIRGKLYIPKVLRNVIAEIYIKYETYACKKIDAVIQVCTIEGKNYFEGKVAKSIYITNFPFLKKEAPGTIPFERRKCVAHIGDLTYNRGISYLVRAVAKTKIKLILCGDFSENKFQKELLSLPEYSAVDYRGFLSKNEIEGVLKECFAGISTILHVDQYHKIDTLPTKVYEYMSMGLPVIVSDTPYAKIMVDKYKFGICVDPANIGEISNAIMYLFNKPHLAKEMGNNGRVAILNELNWEVEKKKLIELYQSL